MTEPRDLNWARRCATDYAANPTDARARNAAQCLPGVIHALDMLQSAYNALAGGWVSPKICWNEHEKLVCYLAAGHEGDHSTHADPRHPHRHTWQQLAYEMCQAVTQGNNEKLICNLPKEHRGPHADALRDPMTRETWHGPAGERGCGDPPWGRVGIDPCPARSHQQESCTKGYMHKGGHKWGPTRPIEAGPELPSPLELETEHYRDTTRTIKPSSVSPQPWDKCPNTPPCEHPSAYHDIESPDDPRYMCCETGCPCGAVILVDPSARISLTEPPERATEPLTGASE